MKRNRNIILCILILGFILVVGLMFLAKFSNQKQEDDSTEMTDDTFQDEREADTEVKFETI